MMPSIVSVNEVVLPIVWVAFYAFWLLSMRFLINAREEHKKKKEKTKKFAGKAPVSAFNQFPILIEQCAKQSNERAAFIYTLNFLLYFGFLLDDRWVDILHVYAA